eukprot:762504-Hanusia_phi.AAC.1
MRKSPDSSPEAMKLKSDQSVSMHDSAFQFSHAVNASFSTLPKSSSREWLRYSRSLLCPDHQKHNVSDFSFSNVKSEQNDGGLPRGNGRKQVSTCPLISPHAQAQSRSCLTLVPNSSKKDKDRAGSAAAARRNEANPTAGLAAGNVAVSDCCVVSRFGVNFAQEHEREEKQRQTKIRKDAKSKRPQEAPDAKVVGRGRACGSHGLRPVLAGVEG